MREDSRMRRSTPRAFLATGLLASLVLAAPSPARAQQVEHAFIFIIDGLRAVEGFDDPQFGFVHPLAFQLAPEGSLLTWMEIRGQTLTLPAHQVMITGNYADVSNTPAYEGRQYLSSRTPTLFESYRMQTGADADSCWVVSNTPLVGEDCSHSLMPGYGGGTYGANVITTYGEETDEWVWDNVDAIMDDHEVGVMLVNLHEVDLAGHAEEWWRYEERALEGSGALTAFWSRLQADPVYQDNSVLVISTDHGRHLDGISSGWKSHGCQCEGCRKGFLMMLGPGIQQNVVSDMACSFLDVAPTVAHLMGLSFPYHRGRVLTDILVDGETLSGGPGGTFRPRMMREGDMIVRLGEIQDTTLHDDEGAHRVSVELSEDGGQSWTDHTTEPSTAIQYSPTAWSDGETLIVGWLEIAAQGEYWYVRLRRLPPNASEWEEVFSEPMIASSTPVGNLVIAPGDEPDSLFLFENNSRNERIRIWYSEDLGATWTEGWGEHEYVRHFPRDLGMVEIGDAWVMVYSAHAQFDSQMHETDPNENTEIYWIRTEDQGDTWSSELAITDDWSPSIQPALALTPDGILHLVWSDRMDGTFQLYHAESTDDGMTFSPPEQLTFGGLGAWEPAVAVDGDQVFVAWSQVDTVDQAAVHLAALEDGSLVDDRVLSAAGRTARTPDILPLGDCSSLVAWTEGDLVGAWELVSEQVVTAGFPATAASAVVDPSQLGVGGDAQELRFTLTIEVGAADGGVGRIELIAPDGYAWAGDAAVEVGGDLVDATPELDDDTLWVHLDVPIVDSGDFLVSADVLPPAAATADPGAFTIVLHQTTEGCSLPVDGDLLVGVVDDGDDDDDVGDDDTTEDIYGDDDTDPNPDDCSCRAAATRGPGAAVVAMMMLAALVLVGRARR